MGTRTMSRSKIQSYLTRKVSYCGPTLSKLTNLQGCTNQNQVALSLMVMVTALQVAVMLYRHPVVLYILLKIQFCSIQGDFDFLFLMKRLLRKVLNNFSNSTALSLLTGNLKHEKCSDGVWLIPFVPYDATSNYVPPKISNPSAFRLYKTVICPQSGLLVPILGATMTPNGEIHPVCGSARSPITNLISPLEPFGMQNIDSDDKYSNKYLNGILNFSDGNGVDHSDFGYASIVNKLNAIVQNVNKLGSICFANGNGLKAQVNYPHTTYAPSTHHPRNFS